jgi:hypothetical protein
MGRGSAFGVSSAMTVDLSNNKKKGQLASFFIPLIGVVMIDDA